jgi:hypothetical protein
MLKLAHSLPLQDMIRGVIQNATEKLASDESSKDGKVRKLLAYEKKEHGHVPTPAEEAAECHEKTASAISSDFVEKLASSCDYIAENLDQIETPAKSVLQKAAESGSPVGAGKGKGALTVSKAIGGEQAYKKDKPKTEDASASQHGSPLSAAGLPGSKTQLENNMHHAPGGGDIKPTGSYPEKGPLVAGPSVKHAGVRSAYINALSGKAKTASPTEKVRSAILAKLAGEDVLKANVDGGGTTSPLAGKGQLKTTQSGEGSPAQTGDSAGGDGNQARRLIASNQAAIDATKRDAKGPVKSQLKEVLDEPALSPSTDSKLEENLRNTGKAGVKIAAAKAALQKIAQAGCQCEGNGECSFCQLKGAVKGRESEKNANAMMGYGGGGMAATADAGAGADGCACGNTGQCRVCKLKAALAAAAGGANAPAPGGM